MKQIIPYLFSICRDKTATGLVAFTFTCFIKIIKLVRIPFYN